MYGIYANIWGILMVNVTIYGIHGSYGIYHILCRKSYLTVYTSENNAMLRLMSVFLL